MNNKNLGHAKAEKSAGYKKMSLNEEVGTHAADPSTLGTKA